MITNTVSAVPNDPVNHINCIVLRYYNKMPTAENVGSHRMSEPRR